MSQANPTADRTRAMTRSAVRTATAVQGGTPAALTMLAASRSGP